MSELITVPTFIFNQGIIGDKDWMGSITVSYYQDCISIKGSDYDDVSDVHLSYDYFEKLFREIKKHLPRALKQLEKK